MRRRRERSQNKSDDAEIEVRLSQGGRAVVFDALIVRGRTLGEIGIAGTRKCPWPPRVGHGQVPALRLAAARDLH